MDKEPIRELPVFISINAPCVIIREKTGVFYTNQVGGYACHHVTIEGFIIQLPSTVYHEVKEGEKSNNDNPYWNVYNFQEEMDKLFAPLKEDSKYAGHGYDDIDVSDADYIDARLPHDDFLRITVDRDLLEQGEEAHIFVKVEIVDYDEQKKPHTVFFDGVLTWNNSD